MYIVWNENLFEILFKAFTRIQKKRRVLTKIRHIKMEISK